MNDECVRFTSVTLTEVWNEALCNVFWACVGLPPMLCKVIPKNPSALNHAAIDIAAVFAMTENADCLLC